MDGFACSDEVARGFERCFFSKDVPPEVTDGLAVKTGRTVTSVLWSL